MLGLISMKQEAFILENQELNAKGCRVNPAHTSRDIFPGWFYLIGWMKMAGGTDLYYIPDGKGCFHHRVISDSLAVEDVLQFFAVHHVLGDLKNLLSLGPEIFNEFR